jgi:uncharacterized protein
MGHIGQNLTDMRRRVPVLALPEYTLFPHTLVPFHVFERQYQDMLDECLTGRRLLVVVGMKPGWEEVAEGEPPPLFDIGGLGRILSDRRFHDGRINIFVHCIERVAIVRTHQDVPFRVVDITDLPDEGVVASDVDPAAASDRLVSSFQRMVGLAANLVRHQGHEGAALARILGTSDDPAVLSNRLAAMVDDPGVRQQLLETLSAGTRCEMLNDYLARQVMSTGNEVAPRAGWIN